MGVGKTTIGIKLAKRLQKPFIDLDDKLEFQNKSSIFNLFKKYGEEKFRNLEHQALLQYSQKKNQVIATGGGIVLLDRNRDILLKNSIVIYLMSDSKTIYSRVKNDNGRLRPILGFNFNIKKIQTILDIRHQLYFSNSHIQFNIKNLSINKIVKQLKMLISKDENNFC